MKTFGIGILLFVTMTTNCLAQQTNGVNNNTSSDAQTTEINPEWQMLELVAIFNDAIDAPTKYNAYVKPYLEIDDFPQKGEASKSEYDKLLVNWINANSATIEQFYIDRQKAHDELYGPRPRK